MKKAFSIGISAALVLSLLTACNSKAVDDSSQPDTAPQEVVETAVQEPPAEPEVLSGPELSELFETAYTTASVSLVGVDTLDAKIDWEIKSLEILVDNDLSKLPADYDEQYKTWRSENISEPVSDAIDKEPPQSTDNQNQDLTTPKSTSDGQISQESKELEEQTKDYWQYEDDLEGLDESQIPDFSDLNTTGNGNGVNELPGHSVADDPTYSLPDWCIIGG